MIPSLPIEITREIILFSLPPLKQTSYRERYNLLLAYSLVDEVWKIIAQEELIKHVFIKNLNKLISIDSEFIRREKVGVRSIVRSIRLDAHSVTDDVDGELSGLKSLFPKIGGCLEEICLKDLFIDQILDDDDLFGSNLLLPRLNRLHLIKTIVDDKSYGKRIDYIAPPNRFTFITHLTIMHLDTMIDDSFFTRFLQRSTFPSLTSLAYFENCDNSDNFSTSLLSFAGQLKNLFLIDDTGQSDMRLMSNLSIFKRLESLSLLDVHSLNTRSKLPISFRSLSIVDPSPTSYLKELQVLKDWITEMDPQRQIRNLSFPLLRTNTKSDLEELEDLVKLTASRNIRLHDSNTNDVTGSGDKWEELFDLLVDER